MRTKASKCWGGWHQRPDLGSPLRRFPPRAHHINSPHATRKHLRRFEHPNQIRFLTFSTYLRLPLFHNDKIKDRFAEHLADAHNRFCFHLYAWVIMPEHIHLLLWPLLPEFPVPVMLKTLKGNFACEVIERWRQLRAPILNRLNQSDGSTRFWQRGGGHDRNIFSQPEFREKLNYIHKNPVERGLVSTPQEWRWSSARWYGEDRSGPVQIDPLPPKKPVGRRGLSSASGA